MSAPLTIIGRLTRDPELTFSANGTPVARFSVVTSQRVKNQQTQEWEDADVSFWDCIAFKNLAENICESLQKGTGVLVTGKMKQEKWKDKEGADRTSWKLVADDLGPSCKWKTVTVSEGAGGNGKPKQSSYDGEPPF